MHQYQRIQRGRGIGGFFNSILKIFSRAAPVISKVAANPTVKKIGKQALTSALAVGADALQGSSVKESSAKEFKKTKNKVGEILKDISKDINKDENRKKRKISSVKISRKRKKIKSESLF